MKQHSDEQLAALALNGDQEAFAVLVERYQKQVFSLAYRLGGDYDEARDLAQEAFIQIYQELGRFDSSRRFFPWMYRVAHNTCINMLRKRPREQPAAEEEMLFVAEDRAHTPEEVFEQQEHYASLAEALLALPEKYRSPLVLKYLEGLSYQQIGEVMDLPVSTIETRLFRGRNMLKKALLPHKK